ncbi:MAG: hypothetical protein IPM98_19230 [Lewinellaceae bacterium]|nr:hypothetical protein [Lewinellaceae bacterium]
MSFTAETDSLFGPYNAIKLAAGDQVNGLRFAFDSPLTNGDYLRLYGSGQSGIYQLAMLPARNQ